MIEWIKSVFGFGKDSDMKLDLKSPIKIPERVLDKVWVKRIVLHSGDIDALPRASIHCQPYSSVDGSYSESDAKVIQIENALENPALGKSIQNLINSLQDAINSNGVAS